MILDTECCLIVHISDLVCRGGCRVSLAGAAGILSREVTAVQLTSPSAHCAQAGCYNSPNLVFCEWVGMAKNERVPKVQQ